MNVRERSVAPRPRSRRHFTRSQGARRPASPLDQRLGDRGARLVEIVTVAPSPSWTRGGLPREFDELWRFVAEAL